MRLRVHSLALLSGLRIRRCRELRCGLQTRFGPRIAMARIRPLAWKPPCATEAAQEMAKRQKKKFYQVYQYYHYWNYNYTPKKIFFLIFFMAAPTAKGNSQAGVK